MSLTLLDSVVLIDISSSDPEWAGWSYERVAEAVLQGGIAINPIVYAEVSMGFETSDPLDEFLARMGVERLELPYEAAFLAGRAFVGYRRRGGERRSPLPDFYIGAHASVAGLSLLTRDAACYRTYFPEIELIAP
ncbi:DNA-binding protein [bacterium SCGC AG-212-C10]|nr:DNA-binding protein [bacterium SCGC AG-212-C10]